MRSEAFNTFVGDKTVTELAQSLHEYTTGSADDWMDRASKIAEVLKEALATWKPASGFTEEYDAAVHNLISVAVREYEARQS